jgi:hypothetical protein
MKDRKIGGDHVWIRTTWDDSDYLLNRLDYSESVTKSSCSEQVKPAVVGSCIQMDRLATWNEVCCAMSFLSHGALELAVACGDFDEMDSDFSGRACNLSEDATWLAIANEMIDSISN